MIKHKEKNIFIFAILSTGRSRCITQYDQACHLSSHRPQFRIYSRQYCRSKYRKDCRHEIYQDLFLLLPALGSRSKVSLFPPYNTLQPHSVPIAELRPNSTKSMSMPVGSFNLSESLISIFIVIFQLSDIQNRTVYFPNWEVDDSNLNAPN